MYLSRFFIFTLGICSQIPSQIYGYMKPPTKLPLPPKNHIKKLQELVILTRASDNLIPVSILNILNGVITRPNDIQTLFVNPYFWTVSIMVHIFTAGSMVLNDLYDIEIDRINSPTRPLVKETVSIKEAIIFVSLLFSLYVYLGCFWLPDVVGPIWKSSLVIVLIYTPILKRIPLVKNLACASIITATVPFIGLSINPTLLSEPSLITNWVFLTMRTLFSTSMFIELILDISDLEGDAKNGINTLPVLFGKQRTVWWLTIFILINYIQSISLCVVSNTGELIRIMYGAVLASNFPIFLNLITIQKAKFSKQSIKKAIRTTTGSMIVYFAIFLLWLKSI